VLPRTRLYNAELGNGFAARYKAPVVRTALVVRVPSGSATARARGSRLAARDYLMRRGEARVDTKGTRSATDLTRALHRPELSSRELPGPPGSLAEMDLATVRKAW
jgi:hypothetical protein